MSKKCLWPEHLPDDPFGQDLALHVVGAICGPEHAAVHNARPGGPGIDCYLDPGRHRHSPHAPVLPEEIHNAPPAIPLLNVAHRKRRHF